MPEVNWLAWAAVWLLAWFWQNVVHELSHLVTGWTLEGRRPLKLVPVPHRYQGRWYWARYESGPATRADADLYEHHRHSAPFEWASYQAGISLVVFGALAISSGLGVFGVEVESDLRRPMVWLVPFIVCSLVDMAVWVFGYVRKRPGTDGYRWRQILERG
jgi:hypothetical protein